jgi:hypothetical protein
MKQPVFDKADIALFQRRIARLEAENNKLRFLLAKFLDLWDSCELTAAMPLELREKIEEALE